MKSKPRMTLLQMLNMSIGFFGIQYGFGLQNANVSRIFETFVAKIRLIPLLWLAAPLTGLIIQPLVGMHSDRAWNRIGRRKPYFLLGALLASSVLLIMPNASALWIAAGALWMMDAAINMTMESFRAVVGDMISESQRNKEFALQSFIIGVGSVLALVMLWILTSWGVSNTASDVKIPESVGFSFYLGAVLFTWIALFTMLIYMTSSTSRNVFGASAPSSELFNVGENRVGVCFAGYIGFGALFSFLIPMIADKLGRGITHVICLFFCAVGLVSVVFATEPWHILPGMIAFGVAWASLLSMPYALLSSSLPAGKMGFYTGIFSFFISILKIVTAALLGLAMKYLFHGDPLWSILTAGILILIASLMMLRVREQVKENKLL